MDTANFQYETLSGIGRPTKQTKVAEADNTEGNGIEAGKEEAYISLLEIIDDTKPAPQKEEPKESVPEETSKGKPSQQEPSSTGPVELPWTRSSRHIKSPSLRLHNEIVEFCRFLEPTEEEDAARQEALERITQVVQSMFPNATVSIFGSYVTGLYLPTSDMDLVVINSGCTDIPRALRGIGSLLVEKGLAKNIQVIAGAKVPIIKFDEIGSGLAFDISFDVANGPKTAKLVTELMRSLPPMRHLVVVLKLFLQQRQMNEVYQGGIGSYALLVMVAAFLLQHQSRIPTKTNRRPKLECNLGLLLLDFFRLYGRTLKQEEVAISCRNGGAFFRKMDYPKFLQRERMYFLAIEDPQDPDNDLAKGTFNIVKVQKAFDFAYRQLSNPIHRSESNLERIIRLDAVLMSRAPANKPAEPTLQAMSEAVGEGRDGAVEANGATGQHQADASAPFQFGQKGSLKQSQSPAKRPKAKHNKKGQPSPGHKNKKKDKRRERDFDLGDNGGQNRRRS